MTAYLLHMRDAIDRVLDYAEPGRDAFMAEPMRQDAIIRNLETAGEAAKQVPGDVRDRAPEIPWRQMAGTRDKLAHDYFGVDLELVWDVVARELPKTREHLLTLIENS